MLLILVLLGLIYALSTGVASNFIYGKLLGKGAFVDANSLSWSGKRNLLVIPGAGVFDDPIHHKVEPSMYAYGRIFVALEIYRKLSEKDLVCHILISGDGGGTEPEAEAYKRCFLNAGVDQKDIMSESWSMSAWENALFSAKMIRDMSAYDGIYLLDSAFHLPKTALYYKKFIPGIVSVPTDSFYIERTFSPSFLYFGYSVFFLNEIFNIFIYEKVLQKYPSEKYGVAVIGERGQDLENSKNQ